MSPAVTERADIREHPNGIAGPAADSLDVRARLTDFKRLCAGWLDGKGLPLAAGGLDRLADLFAAHYPRQSPPPHLYPTPEGEVRAEWSVAGHEVSLDIALDSFHASYHALDLATDAASERTVLLGTADGWQWLAGELRRLAGG